MQFSLEWVERPLNDFERDYRLIYGWRLSDLMLFLLCASMFDMKPRHVDTIWWSYSSGRVYFLSDNRLHFILTWWFYIWFIAVYVLFMYCVLCRSLLLFNVLLASNWGWRHWNPSHFPDHEPPLGTQWQRCPCLLGAKPLWQWGWWDNGPANKGDPSPRHRPADKCSLYRFEATGKLVHPTEDSNQVGCSYTWQRSVSRENSTSPTQEILAHDKSWGGCNNPTLNWPYLGYKIPYLVPRTADCLPLLCPDSDHWKDVFKN